MNHFLSICIAILIINTLTNCGSSVVEEDQNPVSDTLALIPSKATDMMEAFHPYFEANGINPAWNLKINPIGMRFRSENSSLNSVDLPHIEPEVSSDRKIRKYIISLTSGMVEIILSRQDCSSGSFAAKVDFISASNGISQKFEGCGDYQLDKQLDGRWDLESWKGKTVSMKDFPEALPSLTFRAGEMGFSGFLGCSSLHGKLENERWYLSFSDINSTKKDCPSAALEAEILTAMEKVTAYALSGKSLKLKGSDKVLLTFTKAN